MLSLCDRRIWGVLAVATMGCSTLLIGQSTTGQFTGRIQDPSGAVVPGVRVTATSVETGMTRRTTTNELGYYTLPLLPPGSYRLVLDKEGFGAIGRDGVRLEVNQNLRLDFTMEIGALAEKIEVRGETPLLDTVSGAIGAVVENKHIIDIPLNARNPFSLILLVPGVTPSGSGSSDVTLQHTAGTISVNGGRIVSNEFLVDGVSNTATFSNSYNSVASIPSVDAIQEFKVQTNAFSAEFGRTGGGVINIVMKSGTNTMHGSAYEFLRNSKMDANNFFANRAGQILPSFKRNQFGGTLGGPIVKDKAFFFFSYEALRSRGASTTALTLPTKTELAGDFSKTYRRVGGACVPVQLFDPATSRANPGGGFARDPFPNALIPSHRMDRVARELISLYPQANVAGDACTGANNFFSQKSNELATDQVDARADWSLNDTNRLFLSLNWRHRDDKPANHYGTIGYTANPVIKDPSGGIRLDYTRVQTSTFLLNFKFGVNRVEREMPPHAEGLTLAQFGFPSNLDAIITRPADAPRVNLSGYASLGTNYPFAYLHGTTYVWSASASKTSGRHGLRFGAETRVIQTHEYTGFVTSGRYTFSEGFTRGPNPNIARGDLGNSFASLLLGAGSGEIQIVPPIFTSNNYYALYLQDDIKLTPRLSVSLGLRYDLEPGRKERFNQLSYFDFGVRSPLAAVVPGFPALTGGLRFVGVDADSQFDTDKNNFGPRFGISYSLTPRMTVRSGYGIFYTNFVGGASGAGAGYAGFQSATSWLSSLDGISVVNALSNAFPQGLDLPTRSSLGLLTNVGGAFGVTDRDGAIDRHSRVGYVQQWNFNIQRQLPAGVALEAAYVGSKGTKLPYGTTGIQLNQLTQEQLSLGNRLLELVPNPFYGVITSRSTLAQPTIRRSQLLRPYPHFMNVRNLRPSAASSIYHAFQLRAEKRFARGIGFILSYTNSKLIADSDNGIPMAGGGPQPQDSYNLRAERAVSSMDVSQNLTFSVVNEIPVGRGKKYASTLPRWVDAVAGGWQISGILTLTTGTPLFITAPNTSNSYSGSMRPDVAGNPKLSSNRSTTEKLQRWFDTSMFRQPAPFAFGNGPRTLPNVRNDAATSLDLSLFKQFAITERTRLSLRAEFFNFTNSPRFGSPGSVLASNTFGVVSTQANSPRQIQLGLKLLF